MKNIDILGVNIQTLNKKQILQKIEYFLSDGKQYFITTPNPEIILKAQKDKEFLNILNKADLAIPDGIGLKFAGFAMFKNIHRITGADLIKDILQIAKDKIFKVAIANCNNGLSNITDIEKVIKEKYKNLDFIVEDISREIENWKFKIENLADFKPDILISTLGAPWQEKFIYSAMPKLSSVKIGIGVGGAFDFLTGKAKRAPKIMRILGLEWLWRLVKQPKRIKRIYNAVIVFPLKFLKWRLK
ncbi:MAG: WecB/TagA/CpsF family glycosyltransferase [Candidatus Falkowbacteria bacterium]